MNFRIDESVRRRITRCRLVALPKPDGGTRPIAIGDTLLKLAGQLAFHRMTKEIRSYFGDLQSGCLAQGGGERVVHSVRADVEAGSYVLTIDQSNAFNTPLRTALANALHSCPKFRSFWPLFSLEYGLPSELLFYDHGELAATIMSESGVRQGSSLGGFYFCLLIHPTLQELRRKFPGINVYAYMDDVTLTSKDPALLAKAYAWLQGEFEGLGLKFNPKKCEWFGGLSKLQIPQALSSAGVIESIGCIKVLGAYIGFSEDVIAKLSAKLEKHSVFFSRLRLARPDTRTFAIFTKGALPRHNYHMRVHTPSTSDALTLEFDAMCTSLLTEWFDLVEDDTVGWAFIRLPISQGCGVPLTHPQREPAYADSRFAGLQSSEQHKPTGNPPASQSVAAALFNRHASLAIVKDNPALARHLEQTSMRNAGNWLTATTHKMNSAAYVYAWRLRCLAQSSKLPPLAQCVACPRLGPLEQVEFMRHAHGCAALPTGDNSNTKHNACVLAIFNLGKSAGIKSELEPRDFQNYKCTKCGMESSSKESAARHGLLCGVKPLRSGPDIKFVFSATEQCVYDYTTLHAVCSSLLSTKTVTAAKSVKAEKFDRYVASGMIPEKEFKVLMAYSLGGFCPDTYELLGRLAAANGRTTQSVVDEIGVIMQSANGSAIAGAHRASMSSGRHY